jgi:hypothetical protein
MGWGWGIGRAYNRENCFTCVGKNSLKSSSPEQQANFKLHTNTLCVKGIQVCSKKG